MAKRKPELVPVSERALVARINRVLEKDDEVLKRCRENSRWYGDLGRHYIVNFQRNYIIAQQIDLERLGEDLGVIAKHETLAAD